MEALWLNALVVEVEAPKLELSCRAEVLEWLAERLALLFRLAFAV